MYIYIYIHTYTYTSIYMYACIFLRGYVYICMYICIYIYLYMFNYPLIFLTENECSVKLCVCFLQGGVLACWNNPFEVARIRQQRDLALAAHSKSRGKKAVPPQRVRALDGSFVVTPSLEASSFDVIRFVIATEGVQGLFAGIIPRCIVSAHLTVFLVVVPRLLRV